MFYKQARGAMRLAANARIELLKEAAERTARGIHVSPHAPVRRYFSAASSMLRQGRTYLVEGSLEQAFMLLFRYVFFFLEVLPAHPEFASKELADDRRRLKAECKAVLDQVATVKQTLMEQYAAEEDVLREPGEPDGGWAESSVSAAGDAEGDALAARLAALRGEAGDSIPEPGGAGPASAGARVGLRGSASAAGQPPAAPDLPSYDELDMSRPLFPARREAHAPSTQAPSMAPHGYPLPHPTPASVPVRYPLPPVASPQLMGMPTNHSSIGQPPPASRSLPIGGPTGPPFASATAELPPPQQPPRDALFNVMGYPSAGAPSATRPSLRRPAPAAPSLASLNSQPVSYHGQAPPATPSLPTQPPQPPSVPLAPAWQRGMLDIPAAHGGASARACGGGVGDLATSFTPGAFAHASSYAGCGGCGCGISSNIAPVAASARAPSLPTASSRGPATGVPVLSPGQLRPLRIPDSIARSFLEVARANTARNVETCGILLGTLVQGVLIVETVLVPAQKGSADTCVTTNEDQIWEYCDAHELMTLGWIHTHPSQTCFLSSVDLHTHCGYQSTLDEAVAVVLSPAHTPSVGVFRLCHPHPAGLREVQLCRKAGFHPDHQRNGQNPGNGVYEGCLHVQWDTSRSVRVVDLRR